MNIRTLSPPEVPEHPVNKVNEYSSKNDNECTTSIYDILLHTIIGYPSMINDLRYDTIHNYLLRNMESMIYGDVARKARAKI